MKTSFNIDSLQHKCILFPDTAIFSRVMAFLKKNSYGEQIHWTKPCIDQVLYENLLIGSLQKRFISDKAVFSKYTSKFHSRCQRPYKMKETVYWPGILWKPSYRKSSAQFFFRYGHFLPSYGYFLKVKLALKIQSQRAYTLKEILNRSGILWKTYIRCITPDSYSVVNMGLTYGLYTVSSISLSTFSLTVFNTPSLLW